MIALIQRVSQASVEIEENTHATITKGLLILLGITYEDTQKDIDWLGNKIVQLRIFNDQQNKMNLSIKDINGGILLISQFTLHAETKKGNRPSYIKAAKPDIALPLYNQMIETLSTKLSKRIQTGKFGAYMKVNLINDGPVTIYIDTKNKK